MIRRGVISFSSSSSSSSFKSSCFLDKPIISSIVLSSKWNKSNWMPSLTTTVRMRSTAYLSNGPSCRMIHPENSRNPLRKSTPIWSFHHYPTSNGGCSLFSSSSSSFSSSSSKCYPPPLRTTTHPMLPMIIGGVWNSHLGESSNGHRQYYHRYGTRPGGAFGVPATTSAVILQRTFFSSSGGGRRPPTSNSNRLWQGMGLLGSGGLLLWGKGKYLLGVLKLGKLASLGSMLFSVGAYSMFFGLPYAFGMVSLITIHEAGHALVMHQRNIPFSPMLFIPFVGATIAMNRRPQDAWEDALVAFGGPALGSLGALGCSLGGYATDSQLLYALADFGYMINLFNMLPVGMMDGGRIANALSPYAGLAGLGLGGVMIYSGQIHNPIFYLIFLAGGWETFQRFTNSGVVPPNYYRISSLQRAALTGGYVGILGGLFAAMALNNQFKKPPEVLEKEKYWDERY